MQSREFANAGPTSQIPAESGYFPTLDILRFFAAFAVLLAHLEQAKSFFGYSNLWHHATVPLIAQEAVSFFFVLSGFLITHLLVTRPTSNDRESILKFYVRRILRIWPLYFMAVFLGLWVYPQFPLLITPTEYTEIHKDFSQKLILYLLILPNIALTEFAPIPLLSHTWSIGVEEQFYLFWPWVLRLKQKPLTLCLFCWAFFSLFHFFLLSINIHVFGSSVTWILAKLQEYTHHARFNCMAIGGVFATLLPSRAALKIFQRKVLGLGSLVVLVICLGHAFQPKYVATDFYGLLFGLIIFAFAFDTFEGLGMGFRLFSHLGKISYGIYIFHPVFIYLSLHGWTRLYGSLIGGFWEGVVLAIMSLMGTVLLSSFSYHFMESPILKLKTKWY